MAFVTLTIALFFCLAVLPVSWRSVRSSDHQIAANRFAQEILDECAAGPFSRLTPGVYAVDDRLLEDHVVLHPELRIQAGPGATAARLRLLDLRISWEESGRTKFVDRHRRIAQLRR